jgi:hypothetical protein
VLEGQRWVGPCTSTTSSIGAQVPLGYRKEGTVPFDLHSRAAITRCTRTLSRRCRSEQLGGFTRARSQILPPRVRSLRQLPNRPSTRPEARDAESNRYFPFRFFCKSDFPRNSQHDSSVLECCIIRRVRIVPYPCCFVSHSLRTSAELVWLRHAAGT